MNKSALQLLEGANYPLHCHHPLADLQARKVNTRGTHCACTHYDTGMHSVNHCPFVMRAVFGLGAPLYMQHLHYCRIH